ncbi:hypothetical protein BDU57DRAFT_539445 [Ampelomyces quisqualis]|uniref:ubiquitinyl hydrolase 1 n=1 Tax=Ampelomyces quisqualis TaxID=50730 RepID=A0A6A5QI59_AMPQU|nr:hypothetical protein BDU57DRAFT_539445 [Ampelomyces quisqualis]
MASSKELLMSTGAATYLINHIVLPPKLPQESDYNAPYEDCLIDATICALLDLRDHADHDLAKTIMSAVAAITNLKRSRDQEGNVSEIQLRGLLEKLAQATTDETLPLEIKAQNAGLLISRCGDSVVFEPFELSPTNNAAMGNKGRLIRKFPGSASEVHIAVMQERHFRESLAYNVSKLVTQFAPGCRPKVRKNKIMDEEDRDTIAPLLVSDWLMNHIAALGGFTDTVRITKNTREEVLWNDCKHPWRRSPLWLLIRVTLQLHFTRQGSMQQRLDGLYKLFMAQLLARMLRLAKDHWDVIGSEALYIINAKLDRRLRKLEKLQQLELLHPRYTEGLKASMVHIHASIGRHWSMLSANKHTDINTDLLRDLRPEHDIDLKLPKLDKFIVGIAARRPESTSENFTPDSDYPAYSPSELPTALNAFGDHKYFRIAALEAWIEQHLEPWLSIHLHEEGTCERIHCLMKTYHATASAAYAGIPVSLSVMYLSLFELWVACDKSACSLYPLLCQYDPELRLDELQSLVLPLDAQMGRLLEVERYVKSRRNTAIGGAPSVFREFGHPSSFAVKFFNQSPILQTVLSNIERDASDKQRRKREELAKLKLQYKELMNKYNSNECETREEVYNRRYRYTRTVHSYSCSRCAFKQEADSLSIRIYEWPLSPNESTAKATVFELRIPQAFSEWRDACLFMIATVLRYAVEKPEIPQFEYTLDEHHGICDLLSARYCERRIVPLSSVKSHTTTHRGHKAGTISYLQDKDVCLDNALRYFYYDKSQQAYTGVCESTEYVVQNCMYRMPDSRAVPLERFLYRPPSDPNGRTPNEVIASLADCPTHFSIDEYKAFGLLPSGHSIIYSNILVQLATPSVDFAKAETQTLLLQVIAQCGVGNDASSRVSHIILEDETFCHAVLEQLEISLHRVSKNWESWRAAATFVTLCRRVLSLTLSDDVEKRSLRFLADARNISMEWLGRLKQGANASTDEEQRTELYSRATEIALLCVQTYDLDDVFFETVLQSPCAISTLLQCSIMVQENHAVAQSESQNIYKAMLQSWRTLMYRVLPQLRKEILHGHSGLHMAVLENWAGFQPAPGLRWKILSERHKHWLYIWSGSLMVHFNLLTAELLVNGQPLARLPARFMQHSDYGVLFGASTLEVVPTDYPGMHFSAKSSYHDYKLHFGMQNEDLLVVAIKNKTTLNLTPSWMFNGCVPLAFVTDYIHWYDRDRNEVLFRLREDPWSCGSDDWKLIWTGHSWQLVREASILTSISSRTARTLSKILNPLEDPEHIHVILERSTLSLHVQLPRLQLDFQVEHQDDRIQSRQYRGMIVDTDQNMGTLVGLLSKLVLRPSITLEDRLVLIPVPCAFGARSITRAQVPDQHHVYVRINKDEAQKVFAYSLDTILGRVIESGDVQRMLYLAFLHAITSHCLPDPLTGYTGTESALKILQSAAVRSFEFLSQENVELLRHIADLSPLRTFYPPGITDMQQIKWDKALPSLSQHPKFRTIAQDIVKQALTMRLFYPEHMPNTLDWKNSNAYLEQRDSMRSSTFRICDFGAESHTATQDASYPARDVHIRSLRGERAQIAANLVIRDQVGLHTSIPNLGSVMLQKHFKSQTIKGVRSSFTPLDLRFDVEWLCDATEVVTKDWCSLHNALPGLGRTSNKYDIMAWLSTMAFAESADMCVVQAFATFYRSQVLATVKPPSGASFELLQGNTYVPHEIESIARTYAKSFDGSAEVELPKQGTETDQQHINRIESLFQERKDKAIRAFANNLAQQWPCQTPVSPTTTDIATYVNVATAFPTVTAKFNTWYRNRQFLSYLQQTSTLIAQQVVSAVHLSTPLLGALAAIRDTKGAKMMFGVEHIFAGEPPMIIRDGIDHSGMTGIVPPSEPHLSTGENNTLSQSDRNLDSLKKLCESLGSLATSKCETEYVENLRASCTSLQNRQDPSPQVPETWSGQNVQQIFLSYLENCKSYLESFNLALTKAAAGSGLLSDEIGLHVQHSPRMSPTFWLSQLHRDRFTTLPESWKTVIIEYGLAITQLHRAQRLAALSTKPVELLEELRHVGHSNWNPEDFPETLLLEVESGILIRQEQEFIASQMRDSQDATNIVLQLLMGGGKSSTIVPMLAAYLADKKKLVRIIVAKPQSKQMLHMLVSKLGYLLNRRVYHMPFSRSLRPNAADAALIRRSYEECIANRGVLLIQPEHILSFKLMAVEAVLAHLPCAQPLLETQEFFDRTCRDLVDESDENFSVKFELIYTMGTQQSIELAPHRWLMIQAVVDLIPRFARQVKNELPEAIEIQRDDAGRFPRVRILRTDAAHRLLSLVARHVVEYGIVGLPTSSQSPELQAALLRYITEPDLTATEISSVEDSKFWTDSTKSPLLLVRGLIACGILHFALSTKRWRVNYGLDSTRIPATQLAVPYRSKDCPSPRSEFSHPDVVILLTLLSYYYGGIGNQELFDSFAHVTNSDQGAIQYDEWVATASPDLPKPFHQLSGVSTKDRHQCIVELFPSLRYSKKAIDYYLSFLVFPKAMREFPKKLSASGWDIGAVKTHPVTGFSGTNDTLHLLPLTVKHLDLPSQSHTNALVLQYLLQEETSVQLLPPRTTASGSDAEHLLELVVNMQPEVRVMLDCGASILEQNNHQVAEAWLKMRDREIQAVVFFDDENLSVLDRVGRVEPLQTSPFAKHLDVCLVYLDEAHTRGTDLKLPRHYRAAVTLGQGLVKDKLTQGCMRMRKLGVGQSVAFIVPEEISTKIRERTSKRSDLPLEVSDVLCWSITETWQDLKRSMPLWAVQGERFERNKNLLQGASTTEAQATAFLEDEAQSLEVRYKPRPQGESGMSLLQNWDLNNLNIAKIVTRCQEFEAMGFGAATLSEEQERELAPEIEEERQLERPPRLDPEKHLVDPEVARLVCTGRFRTDSSAFKPAFQATSTTSAARFFQLKNFPTDLLVTADFERTVKAPAGVARQTYVSDSYQRPVQFVLSVRKSILSDVENLIIISPFEANQLLPLISRHKKVTLHIFAPRANVSYASLDKLELYNVGREFFPERVPRSLTVQLNLFTGSLYLRSFQEYTELCDFLGLLRSKPVEGQQVYADGFIDPPAGKWQLKRSPVPFLRTWVMKIRREGEGIEKTHVGKILNGVRLEEADFTTDVDISGT